MVGRNQPRDGIVPVCRSGDCVERGEFVVTTRYIEKKGREGRYLKMREWEGVFCLKHLNRVLPARIQMLDPRETMTIKRLKRSK